MERKRLLDSREGRQVEYSPQEKTQRNTILTELQEPKDASANLRHQKIDESDTKGAKAKAKAQIKAEELLISDIQTPILPPEG
ncbi:hypothetical protein N7452_007746 [Penicillium brevicompactum]|uniref:Uncharacterized protein n=1 Tax=Penicillium brevicompactum TaxID=5074 RepID=A0A9W9QG49_PENBR|nr:hypothetical protein N7452_007746 [Penicillium brevicompactum]